MAPTGVLVVLPLILAFVGATVSCFAKVPGKAALGAVTGITFGMWVFSFRPIILLQNELILNLILSFITIAFSFMIFIKKEPLDKYPIIITSAFSGAYAIICGIDVFLNVGIIDVLFAVTQGSYEALPAKV